MAEKFMKKLDFTLNLNRPTICKACGGIMVYTGIGEYECEECGQMDYDDYGKVRGYLENHKSANAAKISEETGVSHKAIREMIKEKMFEVADNRGGYIRCEMCGANINTGRLCNQCEIKYHRQIEEEERNKRSRKATGFGMSGQGGEGQRRFTRER